jgi:hypothetical protein
MKELFLQINSISCTRNHIELNLYKSLTACAMCHQLTPTDTMTSTRIGRICTRCDIRITKAGYKVKTSKTTNAPKN